MPASGREARFRLVVDATRLVHPELDLVDALARLGLMTRRAGGTLQTRNAGDDLRRLVELVGLSEALGLIAELPGQVERGEELGIEEVVESRDPPA